MANNKIKYYEKESALEAVRENGLELMYCSEELRNDIEVVVAAVQNDTRAIEVASEELQNDLEVMMTAALAGDGGMRYLVEKRLAAGDYGEFDERTSNRIALACQLAEKYYPGALNKQNETDKSDENSVNSKENSERHTR